MSQKRFLNILRKLLAKGYIKVEDSINHRGQLERIYRSVAENAAIIMISVMDHEGVKNVYRNESALLKLWNDLHTW